MNKGTSKAEKKQASREMEKRCWRFLQPVLAELQKRLDRRLVKTVLDLVPWGPNSRYFFYGNRLGAIDKPSLGIKTPVFIGWVDQLHFIFPDGNPKPSETKTLVAEIKGDVVIFFDLGIPYFDLVAIKPK